MSGQKRKNMVAVKKQFSEYFQVTVPQFYVSPHSHDPKWYQESEEPVLRCSLNASTQFLGKDEKGKLNISKVQKFSSQNWP